MDQWTALFYAGAVEARGGGVGVEKLDGGMLVGEREFGLVSQIVTGALEGALFVAFVVAALLFAERSLATTDQ